MIQFPGNKGQVRLLCRADGTFELEARRWGPEHDGLREGPDGSRLPPEMMVTPLEYGDKQARAYL